MTRKLTFARKRFGQHFLRDMSVVETILASVNLTKEDHVIEIGPGQGALTKEILKRGISLTAIEIDRDLTKRLKCQFSGVEDLNLLQGDILKIKWHDLVRPDKTNKIVANLPYNISTPFFFKLIEHRNLFHSTTIMVQKELALRLCHSGQGKKLKDYGILSVIATNTFNMNWICEVPPSSFVPMPKVDSAVIQLLPKTNLIKNEKAFFQFVSLAFSARRKFLLTTLRKKQPLLYQDLSLEELQSLATLRPENLLPKQYLQLFQKHTFK